MIRVKGTLLRGEIGDLYAFNGLSFSPRIKGGMIYSDEQGTLQFILPSLRITFDALVSIEGTIQFILPSLDISLSGALSAEGDLSFAIPKPSVKFTGWQETQGVLDVLLPRWGAKFTGSINENGILTVNIPMLRFTGEAESLNEGTLSFTIPSYRISFDSYLSAEGDLNVTIPMTLFHMEQSAEAADYLTMVMNIRNKALTTFDNYNFNSMCAFGGRHFGATGANIFDLDTGDKDNGVPIEWNFKTGYLDLEQKSKKKLVQAWTSYKTDGDIKFTLVQPDGGQYEYILQGIDTTETGLRVKFGKGIKTKYVALNISNIDGSSIDLDELKLHLATSTFVKVR